MKSATLLPLACVMAGCVSVKVECCGDAVPLPDTAGELAAAYRDGTLTAEQAVKAYLVRIDDLDRDGPELHAVLALNPSAVAVARALDAEAKTSGYRGPLHGIPVLVKDNIETKELPTTAGSLALKDNMTGRDAPIIARLRAEGAIILGKTNLSEWANFRSEGSISGWSGMGGLTKNPHSLDRSACGSSSGSGTAVAAGLVPLAIGSETNGSILCPAAMTGIVGFKPTVGLMPRTHIVPISSTQDTAGPMTRSVMDAAVMLTTMAGSDAADVASKEADARRKDYAAALTGDITGMRVGVLRFAEGKTPGVSAIFEEALAVLKARGAVLVDIEEFTPADDLNDDEYAVLQMEFKTTLNDYLRTAAPAVTTRTMSDLIAFNEANAARELAIFDQSIFILSEATGGVDDPSYAAKLENILTGTRMNGIDKLLTENDVTVLVSPARPPAFQYDVVNGDQYPGGSIGSSWMAAIAGYPSITVPMGMYRGLPVGIEFMGTAWDDATVLNVGYTYEQASHKIAEPAFARGPFDIDATASAMKPVEDSP